VIIKIPISVEQFHFVQICDRERNANLRNTKLKIADEESVKYFSVIACSLCKNTISRNMKLLRKQYYSLRKRKKKSKTRK